MVSRERLLSLGVALAERADELRRKPAVRLVGRLLVAALVGFLALRLWQLWRSHPVDFDKLDRVTLVVAIVASIGAVSAYGFVWPYLLRRLGTPAPASWVTLFFKSQLGKYLPGSVWQYAGRVGLARNRSVPTQRALASLAAEVGYSALAAGIASSLLLGPVVACVVLLAAAGIVASTIVFRPLVPSWLAPALRLAPPAVSLYLVVWILYGVAFWTTGRALFPIPVSDLAHYIGVFALAWLAGLVAVFAPGGIGVREAVMVALLRNRLGETEAIVLAATSRIVLTSIDLVGGGAAFGLPALRRSGPRPIGAGQ
jgi:hypothetical protein